MIRTIIISLVTLLLTACGFHLRGYAPLPPELNTLYVSSARPFGGLTRDVKQHLSARHITIVDRADQAPYTLAISDDTLTRTIDSVSTNTQLRQYTLSYTAQFTLLDQNQQTIAGPFSLSASRSYTGQTNQTLGSDNEALSLEKEMQRDLVVQLLYRLSASSTRQALADTKKSVHQIAPQTTKSH
ncbi:MAG: LPS assembly lipoprotein LptE [Gammaproteobacteria bacterium]